MGSEIRHPDPDSTGAGMNFAETTIAGVYVITPQTMHDERGSFTRTFSRDTFTGRGLESVIIECSVSLNHRERTLRGLHYQVEPHAEAKLVRCSRGRIFDVVVDIREASPTYGDWTSVELSAEESNALYVPASCAHGFLTLEEESEVQYMITHAYVPQAARGIRWDDPGPRIEWPHEPAVILERDASYPDFDWHHGRVDD
jgi:dTDP-4-dehydrorhamnose 3,5-epimerase